jgi:hypothetical protein
MGEVSFHHYVMLIKHDDFLWKRVGHLVNYQAS